MKRLIVCLFIGSLALAPAAHGQITVTSLLTLTSAPNGINVSLGQSNAAISWAGSKYCQGIFAVPTSSGGTAIPCVSSLANVGWGSFTNAGANNITIITGVSGTNMVLLKPGDSAVFRFAAAVTAPAAVAATGTTNLQYLITEN